MNVHTHADVERSRENDRAKQAFELQNHFQAFPQNHESKELCIHEKHRVTWWNLAYREMASVTYLWFISFVEDSIAPRKGHTKVVSWVPWDGRPLAGCGVSPLFPITPV